MRTALFALATLPAMLGLSAHTASAAEALTLTASTLTANAGQPVTLTAQAVPTPAPDYFIDIQDTGNGITFECKDSNPCSQVYTYPVAGAHTFVAFLFDGARNLLATSNTITVTWIGTATYTSTLSASATQVQAGQTVALTATASPNVPTGYSLQIYETTTTPQTLLASCATTPCSTSVNHIKAGQHSYVAYLDQTGPSDAIAISNTVSVTWVEPSTLLCQPPTLPIFSSNTGGVNVMLEALVTTSQSVVCFRVDASAVVPTPVSPVVGGAIVISTPPSSQPSVVATNLCSGASGNTLPGPHPLVNVTVAGQPVIVDTYSGPASGGAVWVCASLGTTIDTVVIPTTPPTVSFVADPDSVVQ